MDHVQETWRSVPVDPAPGLAIRRLRRIKGFSQAEIATAFGGTGDQVSRFERGKVAIPVAVLCAIAEALNVEPAALGVDPASARSAPLYTRTTREHELLTAFRRISTDEDQDRAFSSVDAFASRREHAPC